MAAVLVPAVASADTGLAEAGPLNLRLDPFPESPPSPEPSWEIPVAHGLGMLTVTRAVEAVLWPEPFAETDLTIIGEHYVDAYSLPPRWDGQEGFFEWDGDPWVINAVGHALMGSELYLRFRTCHHSPWASLGAAMAGTLVWEYGFEASGVRPSALDLVYTPLSGIALGELRYWVWQLASQWSASGASGVVKALVDPFGELERGLGAYC